MSGPPTGLPTVPLRLSDWFRRPRPVMRTELTRPLPVILPGANTVPRPGHIEAPRGPFEAARPSSPPVQRIADPPPRSASITGSVEPPPATFSVADPGPRPGMIP